MSIQSPFASKAPKSFATTLTKLLGHDVVFASEEERELHSYDAWPLAAKWKLQKKRPYSPDLVVRPHTTAQIQQLMRFATRHQVPITPWGLGSSVTGACLPLYRGITLDLSAMNRTIDIDECNLMVTVEAGKRGSDLEKELNERGYTLGNSPQSLDRSSVGGWLSTRATGQFSSLYGGIEDLTVRFAAVLASGEVIQTQFAPRSAVGPDLRHVFLGAEGTMGVITDVTLKIFPLPQKRVLQAIRFRSVESGLKAMQAMMQGRLRPFLVRFYDEDEAPHAMKDSAFADCVMFLGFEGRAAVVDVEYDAALQIMQEHGGVALGEDPVNAWMDRRFDFSAVENLLAETGGMAETMEVAHFWSGIHDTYRDLKKALAPCANEVLGHFSHAYPQGTSLYIILLGKVADDRSAEKAILTAWKKTMEVCRKRHATISHHHGVGIVRLPYVDGELGAAKNILRKLKRALDPANILNPGKLALPLPAGRSAAAPKSRRSRKKV